MNAWLKNTDTILIGIENAETHAKAWHLCPYSSDEVRNALSFESTQLRIKIIDKIITRCAAL